MYIIKNFNYGIDPNKGEIAKHMPLIQEILDLELKIEGRDDLTFEITHWYHGSCDQDYYPGIIGFHLTDDDGSDYASDLKTLFQREDEYRQVWDEVLPKVLEEIDEFKGQLTDDGWDDDCEQAIIALKQALLGEPAFYTSESSS